MLTCDCDVMIYEDLVKAYAQLEGPVGIEWDITHKCNLQCLHCSVYKTTFVMPDMHELTTDEVYRVIDHLSDEGVFWVNYFGGEPFVRKDFLKIAAYTTKKDMKFRVSTNGVLITKDAVRALKEAQCHEVLISFDGLEDDHDHLRGMKGTFKKALNALRLCSAAGLDTAVSTVVTKYSAPHVEELITFAIDNGATRFGLLRFMHCDAEKEFALPKKDYIPFLKKWADLERVYADRINLTIEEPQMCLIREELGYELGGEPCLAGVTFLAIKPDGSVFPCLRIPYYLGNLKRDTISDMWKSPALVHLRSREFTGICGECAHRYRCGGCRADPFYFEGNIMGDDGVCKLVERE